MKKIFKSIVIVSLMLSYLLTANMMAIRGDINDDNEVDNKDVVSLFRYVSAGEKSEDEFKYDYNKDGEVNNKDVVALFRYVSTGVITSEGLEFSSNGYGYTLTGIGTCKDTEIYIPKNYNNKPVTMIGDRAFADQTQVTAIIIPNTVETICDRAFYNTGITEITIPENVYSIGTQIFYKSDQLETVYYNSTYSPSKDNVFLNTKSIKKIVFNGSCVPSNICYCCAALEEVEILKNIKYIGAYAFSGCSNLSKITFNIETLSMLQCRYQFENCTALESIVLPEGLTDLYHYTFYGCTNLKNITIPSTLISIGDRPFWGCYNLTNVYISDIDSYCKISYYSEDQSMSHAMSYAKHLYLNGKIITDLIIPDTVTKIPAFAFSSDDIKTVSIPDSVVSIGDYAFRDCVSMESITISDSVMRIGNYAFYCCYSLNNVNYTASAEDWELISLGYGNNPLVESNKTFDYDDTNK